MNDPVSIMLSNASDFWQRKYYVGNNPTYRTAIATNTDPTAIAATEGMFHLHNSASSDGGDNRNVIICPLYLKLFCTVANASGTDFSIKVSTDVIERHTDTTGTQLTMNSTFVHSDTTDRPRPTAVAEAWFGDLTLIAASSEKQVGDVIVRPPGSAAAQVIGDEILIAFGSYGQTANVGNTAPATTFTNNAKNFLKSLPPVFLGPGSSLIMQPFSTAGAATGASWYVELGVVELFHDPKNS